MVSLRSKYRSHTCGALRTDDIGQTVTLSGWIHRKRDHGGVLFVDLRDNYGITQVVWNDAHEGKSAVQNLRVESVLTVKGTVVKRDAGMVNEKLSTGTIEVHVTECQVLSESNVLPFQIAEDDNAPENTRLTYRFLELRREGLKESIMLRGKVINKLRSLMQEMGFFEFQTPILTSSSPEGARDFLVPSRRHPGKFYALPQAPQIFKQLLMVSGFDRYFQVAPCFRDEDPRADRSPGEFYQCDVEMSFVTQEEVLCVGERLFSGVFEEFATVPVTKAPFPRIQFWDAIERYGTDKPDLRIPFSIHNVTEAFACTEFKVFQKVLETGGSVVALPIPVEEFPTRKFLDQSVAWFQKEAGQGIGYLLLDEEGYKGSISKFVSEEEVRALRAVTGEKGKLLVYLGAGKSRKIQLPVGKLRTYVAEQLGCIDNDRFEFCWIIDMPLYEEDEETGDIEFGHNPFSMPHGGLEALENSDDLLSIQAYQYDLVCNGYEFVSGAIRNHRPDIMYKAFERVGFSKDEVHRQFGALIEAFQFGTPPHGGFAAGIDRMVMLLANKTKIRDVIPFPLAQTSEDLMMRAPSEPTPQQLSELRIKTIPAEKEQKE